MAFSRIGARIKGMFRHNEDGDFHRFFSGGSGRRYWNSFLRLLDAFLEIALTIAFELRLALVNAKHLCDVVTVDFEIGNHA